MDWWKKTTEKAKKATAKATARLQNQSNKKAFHGVGHTLGTAEDNYRESFPPVANSSPKKSKCNSSAQNSQRELQLKAAESREKSWENRLKAGRKHRYHEEKQIADEYNLKYTGEIKSIETENIRHLNLNPYEAMFSSSIESASANTRIQSQALEKPNEQKTSDYESAITILIEGSPKESLLAVETLQKIIRNILKNPSEKKYTRIRLGNAAIASRIVQTNGALGFLREIGFQHVEETNTSGGSEGFLVLESLNMLILNKAMNQLDAASRMLTVRLNEI